MLRSFRLSATRSQSMTALVRIAMPAIPLALGWEQDGPPPYRAGSIVILYFVEMAIVGAGALLLRLARARYPSRSPISFRHE